MYISTFEFKKVKLLRNMDLVHKTVMLMFDGNRAEENVLYMIMDSKKNGAENAHRGGSKNASGRKIKKKCREFIVSLRYNRGYTNQI